MEIIRRRREPLRIFSLFHQEMTLMSTSASVPHDLDKAGDADARRPPRRTASSTSLYEAMSSRRGDIEEENMFQVCSHPHHRVALPPPNHLPPRRASASRRHPTICPDGARRPIAMFPHAIICVLPDRVHSRHALVRRHFLLLPSSSPLMLQPRGRRLSMEPKVLWISARLTGPQRLMLTQSAEIREAIA